MNERDKIGLLIPEAKAKCLEIEAKCKEKGFDLLIYCTYRSFEEQAKLFRQSHSYNEIIMKSDELRSNGFVFLAETLIEVGSQYGKWATDSSPGESWHQYKEAFDAVPMVNKITLWDYDENKEYWDIYIDLISKCGMFAGANMRKKDMPHCQLRPLHTKPLDMFSPAQVKIYWLNS
jgi:peptidoglycan L-alanyl-D-glutamate endopeptidase CwlK